MGRINSSVGLISGIPINDLVDQLIALSARPRDNLQKLNDKRQAQQLSLSAVSTQLIGLQLTVRKLQATALFDTRTAASGNPNALSVTTRGKPALGNFQFTPLQTVKAQKLLSSGLVSRTDPLSAGTVSFGFGGFVDGDASLDVLNSGAGVSRGQIRITDRSGTSAVVDLTNARTVDDVQAAVAKTTVRVRVETSNDAFRLVDTSGSTAGNLKVEEVGGGITAASLGLAGVNVAADSTDGQRVFRLFNALTLEQLNGGTGVRFDKFVDDLEVTFRDGSSPLRVDFQRLGTAPELITGTTPGLGRSDAQVVFRATAARQDLVGTQVVFVDDDAVVRGQETVAYNAQAKTLTFRINQGRTTAADVVSALKSNTDAAALFTASLPTGVNGAGLALVDDAVTIDGPKSSLVSSAANGANAAIKISALQSSPDFDGVRLILEDNAAVSQGQETVAVNPFDKTITVQIDEGASTANDVIAALNEDALFASVYRAETGPGGDGSGLVTGADTGETSGGAIVTRTNERTIGELLATLNAADPARLRAAISADGSRIELTDLTADNGGTFAVSSLNGSRAAEDLGLTAAATGDTIGGRRVFGGLKTTLLANLKGGAGLGSLGLLDLTDRSGASATVDLSSAETLQDIIDAVNDAGLGISARVNDARNGLTLTDTTGATASNLIVGNADSTNSADKLGLTTDAATTGVNGGNLGRKLIGEATRLSTLNGGRGIARGTLVIRDTQGTERTINLRPETIQTVGDVLSEINAAGLALQARVNSAGDGIELVDTAHGTKTLTVLEGDVTTARDLNLAREAKTVDITGTPTQVIDGTSRSTLLLSGNESLDQLASRINGLNAGVIATVVNDGSSFAPFRLSLESGRPGRLGALQFDSGALGLTFTETQAAQDALLAVGDGSQVLASASNNFENVVDGISVTVLQASLTSVSVSVSRDSGKLVAAVKELVTKYNDIRAAIKKLTNATDGVLQSSNELLSVENELSDPFTRALTGNGAFKAARELGVGLARPAIDPDTNQIIGDLDNLGELELDEAKLTEAFNNRLDDLAAFFTTKDSGFAGVLDRVINRLAAGENALLVNRLGSLDRELVDNQARLDRLDALLNSQRQRLLKNFYNAETAIARIQANLSAINSIQAVPVASRSSSS